MISKGSPEKFTPTPGSWGDGYIIEYDKTTPKKNVSCRDCKYFHKDDNSCFKGVDIKAIGYSNWDKCKYFILEAFANNSKKEEVRKKRGVKYIDKPIIIDSMGRQISDSPKAKNTDKIDKRQNDVQSFNYREIPEVIINHFKRYYNGDQSEYKYCEGFLPRGIYKSFQQLCINGKTEEFDKALCQFADRLGIQITEIERIKKFRKMMRKGMFMLLFSDEKAYSLKSRQFGRLFIDAFAELLEKKGCY